MKLIIALLLASLPAMCESKLHKILFGANVSACLASAFDGATTAAAVGIGAHETNPFLVKEGSGELSYPKLITFKAVSCGLPFVLQWVTHKYLGETKTSDLVSIGGGAVSTGYYAWAGVNNLGVIHQIQSKKR